MRGTNSQRGQDRRYYKVIKTDVTWVIRGFSMSDPIPTEWLEEFEAARRRSLETRFRYSFIHTYKPVLDDVPYRAFDTMEEYRRWCEENLPDWLGYGRV